MQLVNEKNAASIEKYILAQNSDRSKELDIQKIVCVFHSHICSLWLCNASIVNWLMSQKTNVFCVDVKIDLQSNFFAVFQLSSAIEWFIDDLKLLRKVIFDFCVFNVTFKLENFELKWTVLRFKYKIIKWKNGLIYFHRWTKNRKEISFFFHKIKFSQIFFSNI